MGQHFSFIDAVSGILEENWGQQFESIADAQKHLVTNPEKMSAWALASLLCGMRGIRKRQPERDESTPPPYALKTNLKPGAIVYSCEDLECGVGACIVAASDADGYCQLISVNDDGLLYDSKPYLGWFDKDCAITARDALAARAKSDAEYYGPRLEYSKQVLAACESDANIDAFLKGHEFE